MTSRTDNAHKISKTGNLLRRDIATQMFQLASWRKLNDPNSPINIYIEGDGLAWISRTTPSNNPTPIRAIALELAAKDPAPNIVYLARPCQYTSFTAPNNNCAKEYWTDKRFSKNIIASYQDAFNQLAKINKNGFNLIGFSGGANIAGLLAAKRNDILSLRTVAGNIDNDFFTKFHHVSHMPLSLNMADYATQLSHIPQYHFIAEKDNVVPIDIFQSYKQKIESSNCIQYAIVPDTTHLDGWKNIWQTLLQQPLRCTGT